MWTSFFILAYGAGSLISSILPDGHDWSAYLTPLADSVAWLKANNRLFPVALLLTNIGLLMTWASVELVLLAISTAIRIKTYATRAFTLG